MRRLDLGEGPRLYLTGRFGRTDGSEFVGIQVYDGASWRELTRASTTGTDSGGLWYFTAYTTAQGRHIYTVGRNLDVGAAAARFSARYGPICPDLDGSGTVDLADLAVVLADFGGQTQSDDSDNDGDMDLHDLALVLAGFGQSCTR